VERLSYCRICAAACGIVVTVEDDRIVRVRGDAGHPVSRGYTCPKGRALPEFHYQPDRLDYPMLHGSRASWDSCLDDLGSALRSTIEEHGPNSVGVYLGTGMAYDIAGWLTAERLIGGLRTHQRYTPTTIDNAPVLLAAEFVTGTTLSPCWDPAQSRLLVLFGTNPVVSHGYGTALADPVMRLRDFRRAGGQVWVLDPRRTETAALADRHLQLRTGTDHEVLAWLVRELLCEGADQAELASATDPDDVERLRAAVEPFSLERVAAVSGLEPRALCELLSAIRHAGPRLASMAGTGVMMGKNGLVAEWLRWVVQIITGALDRPGGMHFNHGFLFPMEERSWPGAEAPTRPPGPRSRPELSGWANQYPCVAMADEIRSGQLRALLVAGGSPLTAFPDSDLTRQALASLDILAVLDVVSTDLVAMATHVLPMASQLERADLSMLEGVSFRNGNQYTAAIVPPAAERRPAWWALAQVARRLGLEALGSGVDPDASDDISVLARLASRSREGFDRLVAAGPRGCGTGPLVGWVHDRVLPHGRWRVAPPLLVARLAQVHPPPPLVLAPRRQVRSMNSASYGAPDAVRVCLHLADAEAAGVVDHQRVRVTSAFGSICGEAQIDERIAPGTVSLTHGRSALDASRLTSPTVDVDALTGMPLTSGVAVRIEAVT